MTRAHSDYERTRDGYVISTEVERLQINTIHRFLERAYWSIGIPRAVVERAIRHSLPFGLYAAGGEQCGFARVTSDFAVFAMLSDVFVLPQHRGRGLGKWLVETALAHPDLQGLRRWLLATADAHALYRQVGFAELSDPTIFMAIERSPEKLWRQR
jgi:N-acetylglutamate synthase-like GNAT family acetyltransferase